MGPVPRYACPLPAPLPEVPSGPVARGVHVQPGPTIPRSLLHRAPHRERFAGGHPLVWVEQPVTGDLQPWWAPPSARALLASLREGEPLPDGVDGRVAAGLAAVGAFDDGDRSARKALVRKRLEAASRHFAADGWAAVPAVLGDAPRIALASYFSRLVERGLPLGDGQCALRHVVHDERMARFVHHQLTALVSSVASTPVKPSYTYLAVYRRGARLMRHTDRVQCEYTLSVLVDGPPDWPLILSTPAGPVSCGSGPGDGVLFRGCELPHERHALRGDRSIQVLFHYVDVRFSGRLR